MKLMDKHILFMIELNIKVIKINYLINNLVLFKK